MTAQEAREAMALHLWDTGLVRPESLAFEVVDAFLEAGWGKHPDPEWEYGTALLDPMGLIWDEYKCALEQAQETVRIHPSDCPTCFPSKMIAPRASRRR